MSWIKDLLAYIAWRKGDKRNRAKAVALVARAADQRAKSIEKSWQDRLGSFINTASQIAENVTVLLAEQDLAGVDCRDLASLLRLLLGALESLERMMPKPGLGGAGGGGLQIAGIDATYAIAIMARMRGEAPPSAPSPEHALPFTPAEPLALE